MPFYFFQWTEKIIEHVAEHGIEVDDFEAIVGNPLHVTTSRSSGRYLAYGFASDGRYLVCIYELLDDDITVIPYTAYEPD